jgi:hypothetical protein
MMGTSLSTLQLVQRANATDCSGFLKAVARDILKAPLPALNADGLIDFIANGGGGKWVLVGKGKDAAFQAMSYARQGYLVVALLKAADHVQFKLNPVTKKYDIPRPYHHGHVSAVIPVAGREGFPQLVSGSIVPDGQSDGTKGVYGVWRGVDAVNVAYYRSTATVPALQSW